MAGILVNPGFWAGVGRAGAAAWRLLTRAAPAAGAAGGTAIVANELTKAEEEARAREAAGTRTVACATCSDNPCAHLAAGIPGTPFRGGAHGAMASPVGDRLDSHHTPAAAASPLPRVVGPAIQMDPEDHWMTASNGRMPGNAGYIASQRAMVGGGNFLGAVAMDAADIRAKFGDKYDGALAQMEAYAACLKRHGIVR